jgi:DNA-directed RNA polymerase specialized sigma24 family protein
MRSIRRCDPQQRFITWLFAICLNHYRDRYRKRRRWRNLIASFGSAERMECERVRYSDPAPRPEQETFRHECAAALRRALGRLQDIHRLSLLLHCFGEFSLDEIATLLQVPTGTDNCSLLRDLYNQVGDLAARFHEHLVWDAGRDLRDVAGFQAPLLAAFDRLPS